MKYTTKEKKAENPTDEELQSKMEVTNDTLAICEQLEQIKLAIMRL